MILPLVQAAPIAEDWLKEVGFKWHQIDRQTSKQWCLWMGRCIDCPGGTWSSPEDFGIEIAHGAYMGPEKPDAWHCWFRGDTAGRYHRFIHVRALRTQAEVIRIVEALSGREWKPENHIYGALLCQEHADRWRKEEERLDLRLKKDRPAWYEAEKDDTRGPALPEHLDEAIKRGGAK